MTRYVMSAFPLEFWTPVGWVYPFASRDVSELEAICAAAGVVLHGSGIHPGGITERFPLMLSSLCMDIRGVRAEEFSDIRSYATEFVVREVMMFGKSPDEMARSRMGALLGDGFGQSIDMIAAEMGVTLDATKATAHEWAVATAPIETPVGTLGVGTVAAQRFEWSGTVDGAHGIPRPASRVAGGRHRTKPRRGRHGYALRQCHPLRVPGRTWHPHLPRPPAHRRPPDPLKRGRRERNIPADQVRVSTTLSAPVSPARENTS